MTLTSIPYGFNEAGTRTPRKRGAGEIRIVHELVASMRPGRVRPGRAVRAEAVPDFNEAGRYAPEEAHAATATA